MQVTRSRLHHINTGGYEHEETSASITVEVPDSFTVDDIADVLNKALDDFLRQDLLTIRNLTVNDNSYVKEMEL